MRPRITAARCVTTASFALLRRAIFLGDREKSARHILPFVRRRRRREAVLSTTMTITGAGGSSTTKNTAALWPCHLPLACRRCHFHLPLTLSVRAMARRFRAEAARDSYYPDPRDFQAYHPSLVKDTTEGTTGLPIRSGPFDRAVNSRHMAVTLTTTTEPAALFFTSALPSLHLQLLSSMIRRICNCHSLSNQAR